MDLHNGYQGLLLIVGLFSFMWFGLHFLWGLIIQLFYFIRSKFKKEAYIFRWPNPFYSIYLFAKNIKQKIVRKKEQCRIAIQSIKQIKPFIHLNIDGNAPTKNVFIAYTILIFIFGVVWSDLFDMLFKIDLDQWIQLFKAIR